MMTVDIVHKCHPICGIKHYIANWLRICDFTLGAPLNIRCEKYSANLLQIIRGFMDDPLIARKSVFGCQFC